jgi:hypothetical protein
MTPAKLELYYGNRRYVAFRLRARGSSGFVNVASAQEIKLEYSRVGDASVLAPILADRTTPGADWVAGRVLFLVDYTGLTARTGTYNYAITVVQDGTTRTYHADTCEVLPRPSPIPASTPDSSIPVSYTATEVSSAVNVSETAIKAGMPIARSGAGIVPASWNLPVADGVAISDAPTGYVCLYVGSGSRVRRSDWTTVTGTIPLPVSPSQPLYLGPDGTYATLEPETPDALMKQVVGEVGADGQTIIVTLDYVVTL